MHWHTFYLRHTNCCQLHGNWICHKTQTLCICLFGWQLYFIMPICEYHITTCIIYIIDYGNEAHLTNTIMSTWWIDFILWYSCHDNPIVLINSSETSWVNKPITQLTHSIHSVAPNTSLYHYLPTVSQVSNPQNVLILWRFRENLHLWH